MNTEDHLLVNNNLKRLSQKIEKASTKLGLTHESQIIVILSEVEIRQ